LGAIGFQRRRRPPRERCGRCTSSNAVAAPWPHPASAAVYQRAASGDPVAPPVSVPSLLFDPNSQLHTQCRRKSHARSLGSLATPRLWKYDFRFFARSAVSRSRNAPGRDGRRGHRIGSDDLPNPAPGAGTLIDSVRAWRRLLDAGKGEAADAGGRRRLHRGSRIGAALGRAADRMTPPASDDHARCALVDQLDIGPSLKLGRALAHGPPTHPRRLEVLA